MYWFRNKFFVTALSSIGGCSLQHQFCRDAGNKNNRIAFIAIKNRNDIVNGAMMHVENWKTYAQMAHDAAMKRDNVSYGELIVYLSHEH